MYLNYGDRNFFEYGCLVDNDHEENEINILVCRPYDDEENLFQFAECQVDITDSWINRDSVMSFIGMSEEDFDDIQFAIGCIDYYGIENFSDSTFGYDFTMEEIKDKLKYYLIDYSNLEI